MANIEATVDENRDAILLIAHGSRRQEANADLVELAERMRTERPEMDVQIGYLELAEPTIPDGAAQCVQNGASRVYLLPYFLSAGTHVVNDLNDFCRDFKATYAGVEFYVCQPLGLHPYMTKILSERLDEGVRQSSLKP